MILKKLTITLFVLFSTFSYAKTLYSPDIGARIHAISQTLKLSDNILYSCHYSYDTDLGVYTSYAYSYPYGAYKNNCSVFIAINKNISFNIEKPYFYAGWISQSEISSVNFFYEWLSFISKYPDISNIIVNINVKFTDLFQRLYKAQQHKEKLEKKFSQYKDEGINYQKYINEVDSDIQLLSIQGMKLANTTQRLFKTIKPIIIDAEMRMDTITGRTDTMQGLRTFEKEMNKISKMPQGALDDSMAQMVKSIEKAIDGLERALAK